MNESVTADLNVTSCPLTCLFISECVLGNCRSAWMNHCVFPGSAQNKTTSCVCDSASDLFFSMDDLRSEIRYISSHTPSRLWVRNKDGLRTKAFFLSYIRVHFAFILRKRADSVLVEAERGPRSSSMLRLFIRSSALNSSLMVRLQLWEKPCDPKACPCLWPVCPDSLIPFRRIFPFLTSTSWI